MAIVFVAIVVMMLCKDRFRQPKPSIYFDEKGKDFEVELRYLGAVSGDDSEFTDYAERMGYRLKSEGFAWWWLVRSEEHYERFEERLSLSRPDFTMEFKKDYHILSFGRKLNKLTANSRIVYQSQYSSKWEFDMTQYSPNTVYIYAIDFINLHDMELDADMYGQNYYERGKVPSSPAKGIQKKNKRNQKTHKRNFPPPLVSFPHLMLY